MGEVLLTRQLKGKRLELAASGSWTAAHAGELEALVDSVAGEAITAKKVSIDMAGVREFDTFGAWLLERLHAGLDRDRREDRNRGTAAARPQPACGDARRQPGASAQARGRQQAYRRARRRRPSRHQARQRPRPFRRHARGHGRGDHPRAVSPAGVQVHLDGQSARPRCVAGRPHYSPHHVLDRGNHLSAGDLSLSKISAPSSTPSILSVSSCCAKSAC